MTVSDSEGYAPDHLGRVALEPENRLARCNAGCSAGGSALLPVLP